MAIRRSSSSATFPAVRPEELSSYQPTAARMTEGENPAGGTPESGPAPRQGGDRMEAVRKRVSITALIASCPEAGDYVPEVQEIIVELILEAKNCGDEVGFGQILDSYKVAEFRRPAAQKTLFLMRLASLLPKIPEFTGKTAQGQPQGGWRVRAFSADLLDLRWPRIPVTQPDGAETDEHLHAVLAGIRL